MTDVEQFRAVYEISGVYDQRLLPHYFDGREDLDLIDQLLLAHHGRPAGDLSVVEFGCGTGRVTSLLARYARDLVVADYSQAMIDAVSRRYPQARTLCADTRDALADLLDEGQGSSFDLVGAFWSLSYPLGEYFETMTTDGIQPVSDLADAHAKASAFVRDLTRLLALDGHLMALFFDSDTAEQRLVTRLWERIAPFPQEGRSYTRTLLLGALRDAEDAGEGTVTHTRRGGTAWAPHAEAAIAWFNVVHLKNLPALVNDPNVQREIHEFVHRYEQPSGEITLPSGVHIIDFHRAHPSHHLPR
ncbi:class I SAM-dependent methyltransferase [Haloechinothrix halophila]|uniref:class I SAM-dependent methyltransferase n=1 Tax=Haloechinothrix halophila TaxID=1069073 RepID=UPI0004295E22|nr:class I SAM-dependent methyltransferase [Haloechinothrix halophila]